MTLCGEISRTLSPTVMSELRVLCTGFAVATLERPLSYLLAAGARVLHAGTDPALRGEPKAIRQRYEFVPLAGVAGADFGVLNADPKSYQAAARRAAAHLRVLAQTFGPDVFHVHGLDVFADAAVLADIHPMVVSVWGYFEQLLSTTQAPNLDAFSALFAAADGLTVESPLLLRVCAPHLHPDAQLLEFCSGVDGTHFRPAASTAMAHTRRAFGLPVDGSVVLSPRGWARKYRHGDVVQAFASIVEDLPAPARLVFLQLARNPDDAVVQSSIAAVKQTADALGVADRVTWLPALPPALMPTVLNMADIVVSCAVPDTFPATVLEALACEKPVIVPRLPSFEDTVIAQHCAQFEPGNIDDLARVLRDTVLNPPAPAARTAARENVAARYGREPVTRQLLDLYATLARRASSA
jgi:glycosyltransferase involved in cell wall biosynthesis